ncbi:MAG: ferritin-like fold-containing protein [Ornithinimicrobium sp.]|uniref:ferritin-like fold-containing protein n=1 Tax=Ornithinimicrobium sp. TaxID=1977084 RepID=UPI0017F62FBA|nr:hydroxylase [Actinomycetota bacterium]
MHQEPVGEATYQQAVVDVLGALAYAELAGSLQLAADARDAPALDVRLTVARIGAQAWDSYTLIESRLVELGSEPEQAMAPFAAAIDGFHERSRPRDLLEVLVKAYVGDGIARDFYREVSRRVDPQTRELMERVLADHGQDDVLAATIGDALDHRADRAGRLALWGRRLVGEALAQTQRVAVERDALAALLVGAWEVPGAEADLVELGRMLTRLTEAHTVRMRRIGLSA